MTHVSALLAEHGLLIATHNSGKLREIQALLAPLNIQCISAADRVLPEPEENGATFTANAMIKSVAAAQATGMPCLSDDSGLVIPNLGGDPGIYSARWAGPDKNFDYAMKSVRVALKAKQQPLDSDAYFVCVLSLALPDTNFAIPTFGAGKEGAVATTIAGAQQYPKKSSAMGDEEYSITTATQSKVQCINIEGRVHGKLSFPPRGDTGFGYDPIFIATGMQQTFAEISAKEKQRISHRANAFKGFLKLVA